MANDSFELQIKDELQGDETRQFQIYPGELAFIPYLSILGTAQLNDNSGYVGVVAEGGPLNEKNHVKFDPFYCLNLSSSQGGICLNSRKYTDANSFFEFAIPSIITGTPQDIAKELRLRPFQGRFDLLADFIRKIQSPYDSSLERLIMQYSGSGTEITRLTG